MFDSTGDLTLEWMQHSQGGSPCALDPASQAFSGNAMTFMRCMGFSAGSYQPEVQFVAAELEALAR